MPWRLTALAILLALGCADTRAVACDTDADCSPGHGCDPISKHCVRLEGTEGEGGLGDPCSDATECDSGFCSDDLCCDEACDGLCETCNSAGTCGPQANGTDPDNDCDAAACETGSCDGSGACELQQPGFACSAPTCNANGDQEFDACNTAGECTESTIEDCGAFACSDSACLATCEADTDCAEDSLCDLTSNDCVDAVDIIAVNCSGAAGALSDAINDDCLAGTRCYLRVAGICNAVTITGKDIYIAGEGVGARIDGDPDVSAIFVDEDVDPSETAMVLDNMEVANATGTGSGIFVSGSPGDPAVVSIYNSRIFGNGSETDSSDGINAANSTVTVSRTTIDSNTGAGVRISGGTFDITNCAITRNGTAVDAFYGGVSLLSAATGTFIHNTVVDNGGNVLDAGISCEGGATATIERSIVLANAGDEVVGATCTVDATSDVEGDDTDDVDTCGGTPTFENESDGDYHLSSTSPCIDDVACDAAITIDIDGQSRPIGSFCDVGADEVD